MAICSIEAENVKSRDQCIKIKAVMMKIPHFSNHSHSRTISCSRELDP